MFPSAFGPYNLGNNCPLLAGGGGSSNCPVAPPAPDRSRGLVSLAWHAAEYSYAPYTRGKSGVAIQALAADGETEVVAWGGVIENAAFDPTADPMQVALIDLISKGVSNYSDILAVVHAEFNTTITGYVDRSRNLLAAIAPSATFTYSSSPPPSLAGRPPAATIRGRVYTEHV